MRRLALSTCALLALLTAQQAWAQSTDPGAIRSFFAREWRQWVPSRPSLKQCSQCRVASKIDLLNQSMNVQLDPATGVTSGTADLTLKATGTGPVIGVLLDQGVLVSTATLSGGHTASVQNQPYEPYNFAVVHASPAIAVGEQVTLHVAFSGTLQCVLDPNYARPERYCGLGGEMNYVMRGSALPDFMDPYADWSTDAYSLSLVLQVPSGQQVVFSGDLQNTTDDGTHLVTTWGAPNFTNMMTQLAIMGDLGTAPSAGTTPPTTVYYLKNSTQWSTEMASWMQTILPFLDQQSGAQLPFSQLSIVKLPQLDGFDGTATNAVTFLGEQYGTEGAQMFEETLAHENSHLWWGVMVYPSEASLWLVEGMAMISEYDYAASKFHASENRDLYLASRYRENEFGVRYLTDPATLAPLLLSNWNQAPTSMIDNEVWAYIKSSAMLDYLRLSIGETNFATGLVAYRAKCAFASCATKDFREAMEAASGQDLQTFISQFVTANHYPKLVVGFDQVPNGAASKVTVRLAQVDDITTPMELWFVLEDGSVQRKVVTATGKTSTLTVDMPSAVRAVMPNPRQDAILWSTSEQPGDVDMDGEVDGRDLIHCARIIGKKVQNYNSGTILGVDIAFDPRCDNAPNQTIEDADLDPINTNFATVKAP